jgi:hypothetical protein
MGRSLSRHRRLMGLGVVTLLAALSTGCAPAPAPCGSSAASRGSFCYAGIDFGKVEDPLVRQGIRDGCRTGQGTFTKDYRLSGTSQAYRDGWVRGRTLCRPAQWSAAPTTSSHPLPRHDPSFSAAERRRRYSAEEAREARSPYDDRYAPRPPRLESGLESVTY